VERLAPESRDVGEEDIYGERVEEIEERVGWLRELEEMQRGKLRCAVILGPPGQGSVAAEGLGGQHWRRSGAIRC
jgi:hypothetical protein